MNRRHLLLASLALFTAAAHADPREFPPHAQRGRMTPAYFPEILIDGKTRRLAPAARIVNQDNLAELPAALRGSNVVVNYTVNADGDIDRVWMLTAEEARRKP